MPTLYRFFGFTPELLHKKCELSRFIILVLSGLDSHNTPIYAESSHLRVNIRIISDVLFFKVSKFERILNKANAYLCMLFVCCVMP